MTVETTLKRRLEKKLRRNVTMSNVNATMSAAERTAITAAIRAGRSKEVGDRILRIADRYVRNQADSRITAILADNALSTAELDELFA